MRGHKIVHIQRETNLDEVHEERAVHFFGDTCSFCDVIKGPASTKITKSTQHKKLKRCAWDTTRIFAFCVREPSTFSGVPHMLLIRFERESKTATECLEGSFAGHSAGHVILVPRR